MKTKGKSNRKIVGALYIAAICIFVGVVIWAMVGDISKEKQQKENGITGNVQETYKDKEDSDTTSDDNAEILEEQDSGLQTKEEIGEEVGSIDASDDVEW